MLKTPRSGRRRRDSLQVQMRGDGYIAMVGMISRVKETCRERGFRVEAMHPCTLPGIGVSEDEQQQRLRKLEAQLKEADVRSVQEK
jgi:orotidine-5'-phosphate decarboxylase